MTPWINPLEFTATLVGGHMLNPELSQEEGDALNEALDDEYKSWVTYDQVIVDPARITQTS